MGVTVATLLLVQRPAGRLESARWGRLVGWLFIYLATWRIAARFAASRRLDENAERAVRSKWRQVESQPRGPGIGFCAMRYNSRQAVTKFIDTSITAGDTAASPQHVLHTALSTRFIGDYSTPVEGENASLEDRTEN
ncbi:hypothetical protein P171DRAFT_100014 [Karstenula rhodostoma CBS 690.94]|uniref:Uncharacterized protein n=1 Tax=Karstenula rhodostoma CBS 690.94 TaxID=1392251 RepID=A0A9P4PC44_9PLEO|nr:hypothetical protein P171DRAFT_100014 [Karstenula rhodostoma CBS 690.94]